MKITKKQRELLRPYMPNLDKLIADDDFEEFQISLMLATDRFGLDEDSVDDYELNETGLMLERLYHEIFRQNVPKKSFFSRLFKRKSEE